MDELTKLAYADELLTEAVWEKIAEEVGTTPEDAVAEVADAVAENPELAPAVEEAVEAEKESMLQDYAIVMDKLAGKTAPLRDRILGHIGKNKKYYIPAALLGAGGAGFGGGLLAGRAKRSSFDKLAAAKSKAAKGVWSRLKGNMLANPGKWTAGGAGLAAALGAGGGFAVGRRPKKSAAELLAEALYL